MDNVCHTLVGAAMAPAGLRSRTAYAGATLMIGANLPDVDVLVFATVDPRRSRSAAAGRTASWGRRCCRWR